MKPRLKPIPGFPGYFASTTGEIWSLRVSRWGHRRWLKRRLHTGRDGYRDCTLATGNRKTQVKNKPVHVLVALTFLGPRPNGLVVAHRNGDRGDNRVENLAYVTAKENCADRSRHGRTVRGDQSRFAKLRDEDYVRMAKRLQEGVSQRSVAKEFGVSVTTVWAFKTGQIRAHLQHVLH